MKKKRFLSPAKFFIALFIATVAAVGAYLYSQPGSNHSDPNTLVAQYKLLNDSLDNLNFKIQDDSSAEKVRLYNDQQRFLQAQIVALRKEIQTAHNEVQSSPEPQVTDNTAPASEDSISPFLLWGSLGGVTIILGLSIFALLFMSKKRKVKSPPPLPLQEIDEDWDDYQRPVIRPKESRPIALKRDIAPPPPPPVYEETVDHYEPQFPDDSYQSNDQQILRNYGTSEPANEMPYAETQEESPSTAEPWQDSQEQVRQDVIKLARRGFTSSEIARRMRVSQDKVEFILRIHRQKGI